MGYGVAIFNCCHLIESRRARDCIRMAFNVSFVFAAIFFLFKLNFPISEFNFQMSKRKGGGGRVGVGETGFNWKLQVTFESVIRY